MSQLAEKIAKEAEIRGIIPFQRFMELALYCPIFGYYEKERDRIGTGGDYYTSVSVGRLFGELLGFQFGRWLDGGGGKTGGQNPEMGGRGWQIVEAGAHGGELAGDILRWLRKNRPELYGRLEYWIVEPSERRRVWQRENLGEFGNRVRWVASLAELAESLGKSESNQGRAGSPLPAAARTGLRPLPVCQSRAVRFGQAGVRGVIFSNELLDAMPVRRLGWDAGQRCWFEWGVRVEGGRFVWTRMPIQHPKSNPFANLPEELLAALPDGFSVEVSPAAEAWWEEAAKVLEYGRLMTVDYGLTAEEFFMPERPEGTLRAYRRHQVCKDLLANPGEQDITAHVNFTAIREIGESAGLNTEAFVSQAQFLTGIAAQIWKGEDGFGVWGAEETRQFQRLTHPEHLGRPFRVLVQSRLPQGDCNS